MRMADERGAFPVARKMALSDAEPGFARRMIPASFPT